MASFNRYDKFTKDGRVFRVPFIEIPKKNTDVYITYEVGKTRLDNISYQYYGDANYAWLILQANPEFGSLEFNIPHRSLLRVPYPLESTLTQYNSDIDKYESLYGFES